MKVNDLLRWRAQAECGPARLMAIGLVLLLGIGSWPGGKSPLPVLALQEGAIYLAPAVCADFPLLEVSVWSSATPAVLLFVALLALSGLSA